MVTKLVKFASRAISREPGTRKYYYNEIVIPANQNARHQEMPDIIAYRLHTLRDPRASS